MSKFILVRHGHHTEVGRALSGHSAIGLSAGGRQEVERLALRLAQSRIMAVYSSPRLRALQTAEIIAASHRLPVEIANQLDEIDFGSWQGRSFGDLAGDADWARWNARRDIARTPAGDSMDRVRDAAISWLAAHQGEGTILCVSHCDVIRAIAAHYLGLGMDRLLTFDCDPASVTRLDLSGQGGRILSLNERIF